MIISAYYMPFTPPFLSSVIAGIWLQVASRKLQVESLGFWFSVYRLTCRL